MSIVSSAENGHAAHAALRAYVTSADPDGAGLYLTNEVFLYRVISVAACGRGEMVELEDCYSLDVACVPIDQFRTHRLRVVTATPVQRWSTGDPVLDNREI